MTGEAPGSPGRCRAVSCWCAIRWVKVRTKAGHFVNLPIDPEPDPHGNVARCDPGADLFVVLGGENLAAARAAGRELWMPHHASCRARRGGVAVRIDGKEDPLRREQEGEWSGPGRRPK